MGIYRNHKNIGNKNLIIAIILITLMYFFLYSALDQPLLANNVYDSYTIQALQWWKGKVSLDRDYSWLELAYYNDSIYLSFPPFPTVPMFLLVPIFGPNTPSNLITTLYTIISFIIIFKYCKRKECSDETSLFWAALVVFGGNLLSISPFGGVWYQAQALSFLMSLVSIYFITSEKELHWYLAFVFWAFAVGCRPFQIIYLPVYLSILFTHLKAKRKPPVFFLKFLIAPAIIGCLYACYNYIRFDSIYEFGHNYLPEFVEAENGQFHWRYILQNLPNLFRLPFFDGNRLSFPKFDGFAFYISNPIFVVYGVRLIKSAVNRKLSGNDGLFLILILTHIILFLSHKTLGGWQFGMRYFVDIIPFLFLSLSYRDMKVHRHEVILCVFGLFINLYGTLWLNLE